MKILISLSYYTPHISGLTLSVERLAELLAKNGYQITILTTQHDKKLAQQETIDEVTVFRVPFLFRIDKGFIMPSFISQAYQAISKTEKVFVVLPQFEGVLITLLAKVLRKKVYCLYVCEVIVSGGMKAKIIERLLQMMNIMTVQLADVLVTMTDDFAKQNKVLRNSGKTVRSIYPIVSPPLINKEKQNALLHQLPHKKYVIGYLGRIASEKGIEYLLKAIPLLRKELGDTFVLVIAGPKKTVGEASYQEKITRFLKTYNEYIVQLGELADSELGAFYSALDVFVLPSTNNTEAFGMVQVEAMYCGTPAVSTDLPGVRVPIQQTGMGEIVPVQDVSALAHGIIKVLRHKKNYVKQSSEIQYIFSKEKILTAYRTLFTAA